MKNGLEDYYVIKNNKKLRYGYTTGSCAAAAAKAAARMLLTGEKVENIDLMTPKGILLHLEILDIHQGTEEVSCAVRKDGGEEVAKKTFNPRLGIIGGISVLGTSGIVVPMSEDALIASIHAEMRLRKESGDYLLVTPGNYGAAFVSTYPDVDVENSVKCSNYVGETLDYAVNLGIKGILFVADIGKFIKVSGGIMNTHSRCADSRAELMTAAAIRAGADLETAKRLLETITTVEAIGILKEKNLLEKTMAEIIPRVHYYLQHRIGEAFPTEAILFSNEHGFLGETEGAQEMLQHFRTGKNEGGTT